MFSLPQARLLGAALPLLAFVLAAPADTGSNGQLHYPRFVKSPLTLSALTYRPR